MLSIYTELSHGKTLLDLPVFLSHCVASMTDLNVGQIISNTNSLFYCRKLF